MIGPTSRFSQRKERKYATLGRGGGAGALVLVLSRRKRKGGKREFNARKGRERGIAHRRTSPGKED